MALSAAACGGGSLQIGRQRHAEGRHGGRRRWRPAERWPAERAWRGLHGCQSSRGGVGGGNRCPFLQCVLCLVPQRYIYLLAIWSEQRLAQANEQQSLAVWCRESTSHPRDPWIGCRCALQTRGAQSAGGRCQRSQHQWLGSAGRRRKRSHQRQLGSAGGHRQSPLRPRSAGGHLLLVEGTNLVGSAVGHRQPPQLLGLVGRRHQSPQQQQLGPIPLVFIIRRFSNIDF
jgi:hypothetical protein